MASKREKLEEKANSLGLSFVASTTDSELEELIKDFDTEDQEGTQYYKCLNIPGLSIPLGDEEAPSGADLKEVRFQPYEAFDEEKGEHYRVGFLATNEPDVQEILADDANVEEISEEEYKEATEKLKKVA